MAFDIDGARREGYSNAEIADHLARTRSFDVRGARAEGYSDADIINHLTKSSAPAAKPPAPAEAATPETPPALPSGAVETPGGAVMVPQRVGRRKKTEPATPEAATIAAQEPVEQRPFTLPRGAVETPGGAVMAPPRVGRRDPATQAAIASASPAAMPAAPVAAQQPQEGFFERLAKEPEYLGSSLKRGWNDLVTSVNGMRMAEFGELIQTFEKKYTPEQIEKNPKLRAELESRQRSYAQLAADADRRSRENAAILRSSATRPETQRMLGVGEADRGWVKTASDFGRAIVSDPGSVVDLVVGSGPGSLASAAAAALTFFGTRNPAIAAAVGGTGSGAMEFGNEYSENRSKGMPHDEAWKKAALKAGVVGALDAVSMRTAGRSLDIISEAISRGATRTAVKQVGKETLRQAGLGGAGEALGSVAAGKEIEPTGVLAEMVAEIGQAPVEAVSTRGMLQREIDPGAQIARAIESGVAETSFTKEGIRQEAIDAMSGRAPASIADIAGAIPAGRATVPAVPAAPAAEEPAAPVAQAPGAQPPVPQGQQSVEDLVPTIPGMPGEEEVLQPPGEEGVTPVAPSGETSVTPVTLTGEKPEERRMPASVLGAFDLPNGMEVRVFKTNEGFGTGLFDVDSQNYVNGSITRFKGDDALPKAMGKASEMASQAMPGAPTPTGQGPAPTGQTTPTPKPDETTAPEAEPDKPAPGFVRVYHSGSAGEGDSGRWASTDRRYASDYRPDLPLFYLDIPSSDPRVNNPDYPEQGLGQGFTFNFELSPEEASQLKEIPRTTTAKTTPPAPPIEGFVLQNRDRSSEASRNQMQSIAKAPDYERVSFSKTPSGAPIVAMGSIPESQLGRTGTVTTSSGRKIPVQYGVVEAGDIIASNDIDGNVDKRYGDPKVPGLRAIAGNGRTVGLREAYRRGTAGGYRQAMMEDELHDIDPNVIAGMQNPVLVRLMPQESLTPTIGDELNRTDMLELSPVEQAKTDLSRVDLESLSFDDEGGITPSAIAQFINAMPLEERGTLTDRGMPTKQAYQRLENAIFAQAYEDDALIALFAQAQDPEARLVISALMQAAPSMARLKDAGNLDIRDIVTDAARMIISGKRRGLKLSEIAAQSDLTTNPDALIIVKLFADNPRSNKQVVEALTNAANIAYQESIKPAEGLFGPTDTISRRDLINRIGGGSGQTTVAGSKGAGAAPSDAKGEAKPGSAGVPTTGKELPKGEEAPEVIPGEQGEGIGASDQEVKEVSESFDLVASREEITKIFTPPAKNERVQIEKKAQVYVSGQGYMTIEEAKRRIQEWKINAAQQGEGTENSDKVVLSLFDLTGEWSKPWEEAGYQVYRFDIQADKEVGDVNNFSTEFFNDFFSSFEGADVYAILAACPCTDFASSGSRWFGAKDASGETTSSVALVQKTLATIEYFKPAIWAVENPVGRIEKLTGLPPWRASFDPNHFGDPYTKKTLLWGRFNGDMPIAPVEPTEGSKMHKKYGGKSQKTKNARSVTPEGFAYAFFQANNAINNPLMAISNKYDMMDRDVLKKALDAGMTPEDISSAIDDPYYINQDWDAAKQALLKSIERTEGRDLQDKTDTPEEEAGQIKNKVIREKLMEVAKNLGVQVFETSDRPLAGDGYVQIPPEDKLVEGSQSAEQVFAHELGHSIMQRRGMSFNRLPAKEIQKWIPGFEKLKGISKDFRPEVWSHPLPKVRRHARKNDEIIADSLGAFLLGQVSRDQIAPLIDGLKLTDYDLGLKKFDRKTAEDKALAEIEAKNLLTTQTQEELRQKAEREEQARRQSAEAERKAKADEERGDFVLTGSNREADEAAARGQEDLFAETGGAGRRAEPPFGGPERGNTPIGSLTKIEVDGVMRPALNSEGRPIHPTQEGVRNFWRWFGESRVIDDQGRPIVMYHGTTRGGFTVFDRLKTLEWRGAPTMDTVGSWFSNSPSDSTGAGLYARGGGDGDFIYPVYLSIQSPKRYRTFNEFLRNMHRAAGRKMPESAPGRGSTEELRAELAADGHDGIEFEQTANESLMRDISEMQDAVERAKREEFSVKRADRLPYTQKRERLEQTLRSMGKELEEFGSSTEFDEQRVFIAFGPKQIKSATGNVGDFDPEQESILENVDLASRGQTADGVRTAGRRREDMINEYKSLRQKIAAFPRRYAREKLKSYSDRPEDIKALLELAAGLRAAIESTKPTRNTPEDFLARAAKALADGEISQDVFNVIDSAFRKQPEILGGIRLSVREGKPGVLGTFSPLQRIVTLYGMGGQDSATIRHELAHSLEQMMLPEQKKAVFNAWVKALSRAMKQYTDDQSKAYFQAVIEFISNPSNKTLQAAIAKLPSYEMYQFINPSEYWAVNAESLMEAQLGSSWQRFKMAVRRLFEGLKKVFGFDNKYDVHKTFANIMKGSKDRIGRNVLVDYVTGLGGRLTTLENIQPDKDLLEKHNRPHTPMPDQGTVKGYLMNSYKAGKEFFKDAAQDPKQAIVGAGDFVIDGLVAARSKSVWYGAGVEARDFDKYGGQLGTSNGMATASLALDNAIRGGNIGVEVIFKGGIKYDPKSKNIVATKRDKGMRGVYEAEAKLRSKIGDQLATDIIQGYLEAKRSISIMNELYDREQEYESAKQALDDLKKIGADPDDIKAAQSEHDQLLRDLQAIKKAVSSVNMSEDEMQEFASWDQRHPELRDIMENWTAINQNLLRFWRQVGLLSQKRYETLSNIKDYVPWYRIMSDEEDIHSDLQSGTRALTNIGLEKKFKRGRPVAVVDFRAKAGQKEFKIQPSSVVYIEINGKRLSSADMNNLVSVTPSGDVKIDMNLAENDLVVFRTNREIQNIIDNMTTNVMRMTMNGIRQYAANRIVSEYASRDANNKIMTFSGVDKDKGRFNWVTNGKKVVVEIRDPLVAASIYGMDTIGLKMWEPLAVVANLTRRSITLSAAFQVKQVFKDAPTAAFVTGVRNPLALIGGVWKGFLTSLTNTDPVVELLKEAGIGGFHSPARTPEAEIKRRLGIMNRNVFDFVIKGLDHIGDSSDMAQRVSVYKRVLAETGDEAQAMFQAANVINFLHHGSAGAAQFVVKTVPFFGAWANSTDVLVRALVGGGLKGMGRAKALQRLAFTGLLLSSATVLYCMLAGTDPEYEELDDQTRLRNIIIPGTKIMLPMNTTAAYIFKAIPEMLYNKIMLEGTDSAIDRRRLRSALADAALDAVIGPEPVPAGIKPVFEVAINRSFFTERSIIPEALRNVEAAQQYTASTSEIGKMISGMLTIPGTDGKRVISPIEADHLLRGVLGSAGAMAQWVSNSIGAIAEVRPEPSARERPVVGGFLRDEVPRGLESLYYDFKKDVNQKYQTYQTLVNRENLDAAEAYIEKHGDIVAMQKYINKTDSQLGEINREIRRVGETVEKDLTPRERRLEIEDLRKLRLELLEPVRELRQEVYGTETGIERVLKRLRQSQ